MRGPRIGRADRLAALQQRWATEERIGLPPGWPAVVRLLTLPSPGQRPPPPPSEAWAAVRALAELLGPLPSALAEIGVRINRHCGVTQRDAEIARAVDLVRERCFALSCAIARMADTTRAAR